MKTAQNHTKPNIAKQQKTIEHNRKHCRDFIGLSNYTEKMTLVPENLLEKLKDFNYWKEWKNKTPQPQMFIDQHNHDTIGMIALDKEGNLSGSCTTSGLAWKYYGRVGDSPIIGAGLSGLSAAHLLKNHFFHE